MIIGKDKNFNELKEGDYCKYLVDLKDKGLYQFLGQIKYAPSYYGYCLDTIKARKVMDKDTLKVDSKNDESIVNFAPSLMMYTIDTDTIEKTNYFPEKEYNEICIKENIVASYEYEHNDKDGNRIWSDIREIYKTNDKNIYIEKYKNSRTGIVTYKEKPLAEVIEDIAIYNIDKEKYEYEYEYE